MQPKTMPLLLKGPTRLVIFLFYFFFTKKLKTALDNWNSPASMTARPSVAAKEHASFAARPDATERVATTHLDSSEVEQDEEAGAATTEGPPQDWGNNQWRSWKEINPWLFEKDDGL